MTEPRKEVLADYLAARIRKDDSGCWKWTDYVDQKGYGIAHFGGKSRKAHRVVFETYRGPIPEGLQLDHLCRVRSCVNPDHLEPVTLQENIRRGLSGHINRNKTHCPRGHEYTPENTHFAYNGKRYCKACRVSQDAIDYRREYRSRPDVQEKKRAYMKAWKAKQKEGENATA